jgi:hypothetical protein
LRLAAIYDTALGVALMVAAVLFCSFYLYWAASLDCQHPRLADKLAYCSYLQRQQHDRMRLDFRAGVPVD